MLSSYWASQGSECSGCHNELAKHHKDVQLEQEMFAVSAEKLPRAF
jgi:hypothetical protein